MLNFTASAIKYESEKKKVYSCKTRRKEIKENIIVILNFERELGHFGNVHFNKYFKNNNIYIWKERSLKSVTLICLPDRNEEGGGIGGF
jgi:hypothetical protein